MSDMFDQVFRKPDSNKNEVNFFGRPYEWVHNEGRLELYPVPAAPVRIGKWDCCGLLKVLY